MSWLAPLYLAGLAAIAAPVLFHLWRQTPTGRRLFSTLMFLKPSPPRVTKLSRIEHWGLLSLRALALLLIALAFARPVFRVPATLPVIADGGELVAVLVDQSASLKRAGAWDDLQQKSTARLERLGSADRVALFAFADDFQAVVPFADRGEPAPQRSLVSEQLAKLTPTWRGTNLGAALVQTAQALQEAQSRQTVPRRQRIILVSDLQAGSGMEALQSYDWPADISVEWLAVSPKSAENAGLQLVAGGVAASDDRLRIRVTNTAEARVTQFGLHWDRATEAAFQTITVPPGQSRVLALPEIPAAAQSVVLTGDEQPFDNTLWLPQRERPRCTVVYCGGEKPDDVQGLRFYWEGALAANPRMDATVLAGSDPVPTADLPPPLLFVATDPEAAGVAALPAQLSQGKSVLLVGQNAADLTALLTVVGIKDVEVTEARVKDYALLSEIDFESPLFAPFAEAQFADFTGVHFWKHRTLKWPTARTARVLARFDDGDPALVEMSVDNGRVWCLTAGWHPADSQWARSSKFAPWCWRLLELTQGDVPNSAALAVGQPLPLPRSTTATTALQITDPAQHESSWSVSQGPFTKTLEPGVYTQRQEGRAESFAVNLAADESRTSPLDPAQLEALGVNVSTQAPPPAELPALNRLRQQQLAELEHEQRGWRWLLVAGAALLLLETALAASRDHRRRLAMTSSGGES